ncbi:MAG TPA: hypothetical protein VM012_02900 [Flavitalea sp.]|nr:hypothetical protein [Flavitalea sp.]
MKGLHYGQEYLCVPFEDFQPLFHLYFVADEVVLKEITTEHLFVGYHPLLLALPVPFDTHSDKSLFLNFTSQPFSMGNTLKQKDTVARIELKMITDIPVPSPGYRFYRAIHAMHRFVPAFNRWIQSKANHLFNRRPGNIFLEGNLLEQVQVAYSYPRIISLISLKHATGFNLFPTDLHGQIGDTYVVSLRTGGKAAEQVERSKFLAISEVNTHHGKHVYELGKNHMQDPKSFKEFSFSQRTSQVLQIPLPEGAVSYRELQLTDSFRYGIHCVMLFIILNREILESGIHRLAHVHTSYATWRHRNGMVNNIIDRQ